MTKYKLVEKKTINGKKRNIYKKEGSKKEYLKYKGRMMNVVKYKKIKTKKPTKKTKVKKIKGGDYKYKTVLHNNKLITEAARDEYWNDAIRGDTEKINILLKLFKEIDKDYNVFSDQTLQNINIEDFSKWLQTNKKEKIAKFHRYVAKEEWDEDERKEKDENDRVMRKRLDMEAMIAKNKKSKSIYKTLQKPFASIKSLFSKPS